MKTSSFDFSNLGDETSMLPRKVGDLTTSNAVLNPRRTEIWFDWTAAQS